MLYSIYISYYTYFIADLTIQIFINVGKSLQSDHPNIYTWVFLMCFAGVPVKSSANLCMHKLCTSFLHVLTRVRVCSTHAKVCRFIFLFDTIFCLILHLWFLLQGSFANSSEICKTWQSQTEQTCHQVHINSVSKERNYSQPSIWGILEYFIKRSQNSQYHNFKWKIIDQFYASWMHIYKHGWV